MWQAILHGTATNGFDMNGGAEDGVPSPRGGTSVNNGTTTTSRSKLSVPAYAELAAATAGVATVLGLGALGFTAEKHLRANPPHLPSPSSSLSGLPSPGFKGHTFYPRFWMSTLASDPLHKPNPKLYYRPNTFPARVGIVVASIGLCMAATLAVHAYTAKLVGEVRLLPARCHCNGNVDPLNSAFLDRGVLHRTHAVYCPVNHPPYVHRPWRSLVLADWAVWTHRCRRGHSLRHGRPRRYATERRLRARARSSPVPSASTSNEFPMAPTSNCSVRVVRIRSRLKAN
jgi:hypothetical protein